MTTWLTSDWHLFHERIIELTDRPFRNVDDMHSTILGQYHSRVQPDDTVWFLGDLTLRGPKQIKSIRAIVGQLPGNKHFIVGNHDRLKPESYLRMGFLSFHTSADILYRDRWYHLVHDPVDALSGTKRLICGHVHNNWKSRTQPYRTVNIGVDSWDFRPVCLAEAVTALEQA